MANRVGAGSDLPRCALEAITLETYRAGRLNNLELREMLGMETRYEMDGFLKQHGVYEAYSLADLECERESLRLVGF